jgi:hypothetical protein
MKHPRLFASGRSPVRSGAVASPVGCCIPLRTDAFRRRCLGRLILQHAYVGEFDRYAA